MGSGCLTQGILSLVMLVITEFEARNRPSSTLSYNINEETTKGSSAFIAQVS